MASVRVDRARHRTYTVAMRLPALLLVVVAMQAEDLALADGGTVPVVRLAEGGIAVAMVPDLGGKLVSLRGPDGYEWLSRSGRPYRRRAGLEAFGDAEFDGADEIFPTMDPCDGLPAHGEAWRLPWTRIEGPGLSYAVDGRLRAYRLSRSVAIEGNAVVLSYALANRGPADLRYFYLFHPLFSIAEPLRLEFPAGQAVRITGSQHHFLGREGTVVPWADLSAGPFVAATAAMAGKRFWSLAVDSAPAFVRLRRPGGQTLTMSWEVAALPRLAVWCSEASPFVGDLAHLAPEPSTGLTRRLSDAVADGSAATVPAGAVAGWRIRLAFAP